MSWACVRSYISAHSRKALRGLRLGPARQTRCPFLATGSSSLSQLLGVLSSASAWMSGELWCSSRPECSTTTARACLIFHMGISISGKGGLYIETGPWSILTGSTWSTTGCPTDNSYQQPWLRDWLGGLLATSPRAVSRTITLFQL